MVRTNRFLHVFRAALPLVWLAAEAGAAEPPAASLVGPPRPWFERVLVGMEIGPTGAQFGCDREDRGFAARFDGHEIVRRCAAAGCEYVVIWARDGEWTYYNSKLEPKCPGLGQRDVLREAVDEARQHRLPIIAYCVQQYCNQTLREHPDWCMRDPQGKPIDRVCYNSPYVDYMKKLLAEMLAYGIEGLHLDMVDSGFGPPFGCWCDACRKIFAAKHGRAMPAGPTWDSDWDAMLEFRYESSARYERTLRDWLKQTAPKVTVDFNYHGSPPFSWEVGQRPVQHAGNGDFITGETGMWGFSALGVALNAEFYRAATPGLPIQVAINRGARIYHDQTTRPLNDLRWELFTLLAHGAFVTVIDKTGYDGALDPMAYERIGAAFREVHAKREHFGHRSVQEVGIYFSARTRDWAGRDQPGEYFEGFQGAHKALTYEHISCGVLLDENISGERLRQFPVVLLPNVAVLSEREVAVLTQYVQGGGKLLVTGWTGQFGLRNEPLGQSVLEALIGAEAAGRLEGRDNHVRFPGPSGESRPATSRGARENDDPTTIAAHLRGAAPAGWPFLVYGPATIYRPTTAIFVGELLRPHRTVRQQKGQEGVIYPMSADSPVGPAALVHRLGKGTVLTFACSPDYATASEYQIVEARKLLRNAVRWLEPQPRVEILAPNNVETVITDDPAGRKLRVHLLAYLAAPTATSPKNRPYVLPSLVEDPPMFRATIRLRDPIHAARALNPGTTIKVVDAGRRLEVLAEEVFETLVLEY